MHYLTGIIIKSNDELTNSEAREIAKDVLDKYENDVWDWYENSPGRWADLYEYDGVFKATSPDFFRVMNELIESQRNHYEYIVKKIEGEVIFKGTTVYDSLIDISRYKNKYESKTRLSSSDGYDLWCLRNFADCVSGKFTSDSHIYDANEYTSFIDEDMLSNYHTYPDLYYLVLFDIHN